MGDPMNYEKRLENGAPIIHMSGRFTFTDYKLFREILSALREGEGRRRVLDLTALEFVDSAALGMLLIAREEAQQGGRAIVLRGAGGQVRRTLDTADMSTLFDIEA